MLAYTQKLTRNHRNNTKRNILCSWFFIIEKRTDQNNSEAFTKFAELVAKSVSSVPVI